jgi:hypothetical protein
VRDARDGEDEETCFEDYAANSCAGDISSTQIGKTIRLQYIVATEL